MKDIKFSHLVHWTDKQKEADKAIEHYKYILYGGAMGGGKSYWLRWELVKLLLYYYAKYNVKNVMVGLFCEDYPTLKDRHLVKINVEFPDWLGDYRSQDHNFILKPEYGSGILAFRNLDDVSKYQSAEFAVEGVDELTKNLEDVFNFLRTRLRWPDLPANEWKFLAGTNPGGIGHGWVKKKWIDKQFDLEEKETHLFYFIPAKAVDNPYLDKSYYQSLDSLPETLRKAFLEGNWDIFRGQYFTEWRRDIHTCQPFTISNDWMKFISIDYGYNSPVAVYWNAVSPDGIIYVYRELYKTGLTFSAMTKEIISLTPYNEDIKYWVADPSCWIKGKEKDLEALSGADIMEDVYREKMKELKQKKILTLLQGNNDRLNGWRTVREYLKPILSKDETVIARLQVFSTCTEFIRTFPALVYDTIKTEDVDSDGEDHSGDSIRYGLMSRPIPGRTQEQIIKDFFEKKIRGQSQKKKSREKSFRMTNY